MQDDHKQRPAVDGVELAPSRRSLLRNVAGLSVLPLGSNLIGSGQAAAAAQATLPPKTSFALAVMPDTQFYSRYATTDENQQFQHEYGSTPYTAQTKFIVDNAARYNIPFAIHLGDLVDQSRKPHQWAIADAAMNQLEVAGVPYSVCAGNHDVLAAYDYNVPSDQGFGTDAQRTASQEPYLKWFPGSRAAKQATFKGRDPSGWHEYHIFSAFGVRFLVLSMSWRASDAAIAWARNVIKQNYTLPVILVNHQLLNIDRDGVSPLEVPYGEMLWEKLIRDNDQIFMTLNGHYHGGARLRKINDFGNIVEEMVVDYQMAYQGGNGLLRLYEFDFTSNKIDVVSFSPWVVQKPKGTLNQFDRAWLTETNHRFSIPIDFKQRFSRFTSFEPIWSRTGTAILPRVKQDLFANYVEPTVPPKVRPHDLNDYPFVAETVAHWRVNPSAAGSVVQVGGLLADITGKNPMRRGQLIAPGQLNDVVVSADCHYLSSAQGSVRFLNTDKKVGRFNYFTTDVGAPINAELFSKGYTIEAFIKFDPNWIASNHAWSNIMARLGNRGTLPKYAGGDPESPPILFALSSLREVQWEIVPSSNTSQPLANWSGEIMWDTWYHVAIVNDPATKETTMYVEGAPVLRNIAGGVGIASAGANRPWVLGCSWWNGALTDGWFGSIGEVRIVGKPLDSQSWLTARRA